MTEPRYIYDFDEACEGILPDRANAHRRRDVEHQRAADGDFAFEFFGDEPITPRRSLPRDQLGRIARHIVAQVEQLAARAGSEQPVRAEDRQKIMPFLVRRGIRAFDQWRQHADAGSIANEGGAVEEAMDVGDGRLQPVETEPAGGAGMDAIFDDQRRGVEHVAGPRVAILPSRKRRHPIDGQDERERARSAPVQFGANRREPPGPEDGDGPRPCRDLAVDRETSRKLPRFPGKASPTKEEPDQQGARRQHQRRDAARETECHRDGHQGEPPPTTRGQHEVIIIVAASMSSMTCVNEARLAHRGERGVRSRRADRPGRD